MAKTAWKETAEVIGIGAIVASLIFVGLQMQQDRLLKRAELGAVTQEFSSSIELTLADSAVSAAWVKMLERPEDLSAEEMIQVNSVLAAMRRLFLRECYLVSMDVFGECENLIRGQARRYFGSRYAQSWWQVIHTSRLGANDPYGTAQLLDDIITGVDSSTGLVQLENMKDGCSAECSRRDLQLTSRHALGNVIRLPER